jgi:hypothetical protein
MLGLVALDTRMGLDCAEHSYMGRVAGSQYQ